MTIEQMTEVAIAPQPPSNIDVEEAYIGSALLNPSSVVKTSRVVASDFYLYRHQLIWNVIVSLVNNDIVPDITTVGDMLKRQNKLEDIGGYAYITHMLNAVPSWTRHEEYARIIIDYSYRRTILEQASELARAAYDAEINIDDRVLTILDDIKNGKRTIGEVETAGEIMSRILDRVDEMRLNPRDIWGQATGFFDIDKLTGGIQKFEFWLIGGEPGVGKSIFASQIISNVVLSQNPTPALVMSLEMDNDTIGMRWASAQAKVPTRRLKSGKIDATEYQNFLKAIEQFEQAPLYSYDKPNLDLPTLRSLVYEYRERYGIGLCMLDYMLLMKGRKGQDKTERSEDLARGIKQIAREWGVPLLTINAVTKAGMDTNAIRKSDMSGGGEVLHAADVICQLQRKSNEQFGGNDILSIVFTKVRDVPGANKIVELYARSDYPAFENINGYPTSMRHPNRDLLEFAT